jgi:hypothetical protein
VTFDPDNIRIIATNNSGEENGNFTSFNCYRLNSSLNSSKQRPIFLCLVGLWCIAVYNCLCTFAGNKKDVAAEEKDLIENDGMKKCPFCAEIIKNEAIKCKHCGSDLMRFTTG